MTKPDIYVAVIIAIIALTIFSRDRFVRTTPDFLLVTKSGKQICEHRLPSAEIIQIRDGKNEWTLEVKDYSIRAKKSDCPLKYCVNQGWVSNSFQSIVCVPLKICAELKGSRGEGFIDALTQ